MANYTDLIDELTWFAEQDKDFIALHESTNTKSAQAIRQLVAEREGVRSALNDWLEKTEWVQDEAKPKDLGKHRADVMNEQITALKSERDAAFAMSKCECESNEACRNLVALHEEVTYLEECVSSHEKDKCSAQESFGKCRTENQKLHKEITSLKYALCVALENICGAKLCEVNSMSSRQEMLRLMTKAITTIDEALK